MIKRIHNSKQVLNPETVRKMKDYGNSLLGKHYDLYFEWSAKHVISPIDMFQSKELITVRE